MELKDYEKAETTNIDFKIDLETQKPKSWLKSVSAFANTKGGIILFGIADETHEHIGVKNVAKNTEKISELINSKIEPLPRYEINCFEEDGKDFIELQIGDGPLTPYYYVSDGRKEAFVRSGNQSIPAPRHMLQNLILKGKNVTFDSLPSMFEKEDLSFTLLMATLKEKTGKEFNKDRDYISLGLINQENKLTNAAVLLSDQGFLKQSKVICTRWNGLVKGSIKEDALDDRLEIVSPGGMIDGTQIQNLEIGKVPSMRRNTIISDIFSRLHFMDRRGSGLSRILESYNDFLEKPKFLSDESSFTVIFPNKGYSPVLKLKNPVMAGQNRNLVSDEDYFLIKLYKNLQDKVKPKTLGQVKSFFEIFGYEKSFSREEIKEHFGVKNSRASEIISLLITNNIIEDYKGTEYIFTK